MLNLDAEQIAKLVELRSIGVKSINGYKGEIGDVEFFEVGPEEQRRRDLIAAEAVSSEERAMMETMGAKERAEYMKEKLGRTFYASA